MLRFPKSRGPLFRSAVRDFFLATSSPPLYGLNVKNKSPLLEGLPKATTRYKPQW